MKTQTLSKLVICHIDCTIWSGRKRLRPDDFKLADGSQLPPREVASLGSKKICDPEALAQFDRLKKEAQRLCEQIGIRFLGGYALPEDRADALIPELERIQKAFVRARDQFLRNYDQVTLQWTDRHPDFADSIRSAITPVEQVAQRLQFEFTFYRIEPGKQAPKGFKQKVSDMGNTLMQEIAREAGELFNRSLCGKDQIGQRTLGPLRRMREKLDGLAFLDRRAQPLVRGIDQLLPRLPSTGTISGSLFHELLALVLILGDPVKMKQYGEGKLSLTTAKPTPSTPSVQVPSSSSSRLGYHSEPSRPAPPADNPSHSFYF